MRLGGVIVSFKLSAKGESQARRVQPVRSSEDAILVHLFEEKDPRELEEIAAALRMDEEICRRVLLRLANQDFVMEV